MGRRDVTTGWSPTRWANDLSVLLSAVLGADRFPVNVPEVAREFSRRRYPDDPIAVVKGHRLPGFDGALFCAPPGRKGWGIFFNTAITSAGRINFTLAHEFGHYLMHRLAYPNGICCGDQDVVRWDSEYGQIEHQANVFAAWLLMPLDNYRRQIGAKDKVDLDLISHCADRYRVSLIAAILRWLEYTEKRAVLVVSRDRFILWARSSPPAYRTGAFFGTKGGPIPLPAASLAAREDRITDGRAGVDLAPGVWLREPVREMTVFADQYEFAISLLLLPDDAWPAWHAEERELDVVDRLT